MNVQEIELPIVAAKAPRFMPDEIVAQCKTYREAVWMAWENRSIKTMNKSILCMVCGLYAPHATRFINPSAVDKHGTRRADLPAEKIAVYEKAVGNRIVSQWLARHALLTLMEEVIDSRR